ncbi:hypothetical protein EON64_19525 [archaeon]|nr:MAG: hypothetical protein EON64_19525 [archaeon]
MKFYTLDDSAVFVLKQRAPSSVASLYPDSPMATVRARSVSEARERDAYMYHVYGVRETRERQEQVAVPSTGVRGHAFSP